jgi:hypothetical protein
MLTTTALHKLPSGKFVRFDKTDDMDGKAHDCVVWAWTDETGLRIGYFDVFTGEYLGDTI